MRVVAGRHKGRAIAAPDGRWLRPTADRVREAVFNVLVHRDEDPVAGGRVLDAFCGTGAMGIEALSRGAANATFMDRDRRAIGVCRGNLTALDEVSNATTVIADCLAPSPAPEPCTLIFLDPPYREGLAAPALTALRQAGWVADNATCVIELAARESFEAPEGFEEWDERRYGAARIRFLRAGSPPAE